MSNPLLQAYLEVEMAMERFTLVLHEHVDQLRNTEPSGSDKLHRMANGTKAMRDSASIYLSYAKYVAHGMPASEELIEDDLQG